MNLLWIEGSRTIAPSFVPDVRRKGYRVETVPTGSAAQTYLQSQPADLVVINAASLRTSGRRICRALHHLQASLPILAICDQVRGDGNLDASQILVLPFTLRKLLNRIRSLLPEQAGKARKTGPITFFPDGNRVQIEGGKMQSLTPTLAALLNALLQHPGEVVERERIFREVWQTDYTDDTRSLDVHIRWLRQKIEQDPRKPQLLKTIRGVGFRLDV